MKVPRPKSRAHTPEPSTATSPSPTQSAEALPPFTLPPSSNTEPPIVSFRASCMRKSRRPQGVNVGLLHITETQLIFNAKYLNVAPEDANVTIELCEVHHARRSTCFKRVLPHGVVVKCRRGPDYVMIMPSADLQEKLIKHISQLLSRAPRQKRGVAFARLASDSSTERASHGAEKDAPRMKRSQNSPPHNNPPDASASKSSASSERLAALFGKRRKKSGVTDDTATPQESDDFINNSSTLKPQKAPTTIKPMEREVQSNTPIKGFAFATDITSQMVEMTISVPIPDVGAVIKHVQSIRLSESLFFLLATSFLLITTYAILSSVRLMSFRLAVIKEMVSRR